MGASVLRAGHGGIARVARMSARALMEAGVTCDLTAFVDDAPIEIAGHRGRALAGNKLGYAAAMHAAALNHQRFLYDAVGPARAHPRLPGFRRPYGLWIHGVEVWDSLSSDRARVLRGADFVLANSNFTLGRFAQLHWPLENAQVCELATEEDTAPAQVWQRDAATPPGVLMLGRIEKGEMYKGQSEMICAWPGVVARSPAARLVIAGGGSAVEEIRALAAASPVAAQIDVLGFVSDARLSELWREAWVFALPSRGEGFGLVYIEAMRHGLPVIASTYDAGQEVNRHGETGFNIDPSNSAALVNCVATLLDSPELCAKMAAAGQALWANKYRYSQFRDRFLNVLSLSCAG